MSDETLLLTRRGSRRMSWLLILGVSLVGLGACDSLLDVNLRSELQRDDLQNPSTATAQVNSAIAHFECGYSTFAYWIAGDEDAMDPTSGVYWAAGAHRFDPYPERGTCDSNDQEDAFYDQFSVSRVMARDIYDRLNGEGAWTVAQVPDKERLSAIAALYAGAVLEWLGGLFCEVALDGGPLLTPDETLDLALDWVARAEGHIAMTGDFALPHGVTVNGGANGGAQALANALEARILWAKGDLAGANAAAQAVPMGFKALVTRGGGLQRRNKVFQQGVQAAYSSVAGVNDWWTGNPNPDGGGPWPAVIPFTGYRHLGILPDGRAVWDDNQLPVRLEGPHRKLGDDAAVPDTRVPVEQRTVTGGAVGFIPLKYTASEDPIPFVSWEEIWLIRAEAASGQTAIDLVNDIREAHSLPLVTYADPANATQIRNMIIEEKRRSLWLEARYIMTKIQNTDILWFPRHQGTTPSQKADYWGGVRRVMPTAEYELNENLTLDDRATGCPPAQAPVRF